MPTPHQMTRTQTLEHGAEEWSCAQCGRRLLLRWPPAFEKVVLERGDEWAAHASAASDLRPVIEARRAGPGGLAARDRGWLAEHGIDWEPGDSF